MNFRPSKSSALYRHVHFEAGRGDRLVQEDTGSHLVGESKQIMGCCCNDDYEQTVWFELNKGQGRKTMDV